jgi:MarR family transcriptional regulator, lower aerobic nicotinate degradation pathway regulator
MVLSQVEAASQQQLSRAVGVDPRNAVPVIDLLQQRHLVERRPDPTDRRRYAVALTARGRRTLDELRRAGEDVEDELLAVLTAAERAALHRTLRKLLRAPDG